MPGCHARAPRALKSGRREGQHGLPRAGLREGPTPSRCIQNDLINAKECHRDIHGPRPPAAHEAASIAYAEGVGVVEPSRLPPAPKFHHIDHPGHSPGRVFRPGGSQQRRHSDFIFLCGGCPDQPRIWSQRAAAVPPVGLAVKPTEGRSPRCNKQGRDEENSSFTWPRGGVGVSNIGRGGGGNSAPRACPKPLLRFKRLRFSDTYQQRRVNR